MDFSCTSWEEVLPLISRRRSVGSFVRERSGNSTTFGYFSAGSKAGGSLTGDGSDDGSSSADSLCVRLFGRAAFTAGGCPAPPRGKAALRAAFMPFRTKKTSPSNTTTNNTRIYIMRRSMPQAFHTPTKPVSAHFLCINGCQYRPREQNSERLWKFQGSCQ